MSLAINKITGEIIDGAELRALPLEEVIANRENYACPFEPCSAPATPCSFRPENKKASYFRYEKNSHIESCGLHPTKKVKRDPDAIAFETSLGRKDINHSCYAVSTKWPYFATPA